MHSNPQKLAAEFAGTFAVVLISTGAVCAASYFQGSAPGLAAPLGAVHRLAFAIGYGVAYGAAIAALGRISGGHFNPAVTTAYWTTHRFGTFDTLLYVAAQLGGATVAAYALQIAMPSAASAPLLAPPVLASDMTRGPAMLIEAAMTFSLVFALWTTVVGRRRPRYWLAGIIAGAVVAAASFAGAPYTGGAMNPARAFGPALADGQWAYQPVYWIGPLAGAVVAASLYDLLFRRGHSRALPVPHNTSA